MKEQSTEALWYVAAGRAELRPESVPAPAAGEVEVRSLFGAVSRGTERLVFEGRVPASQYQRMRAPHMGGAFPFPAKYGYATVGRVAGGSGELAGRVVFALHPHQRVFTLPVSAVVPVPRDVPPARAVLAANMETALNAVWDGAPGPADRIAVVGGGVVGLLVARLCSRLPGAEVTVIDVAPSRREIAQTLGAAFAPPSDAPHDCDLVFHASASASGLATALASAGQEAAIVEMSWYGADEVTAPLGEAFHSRRLRLLASQVGEVAPSHRPRWERSRRLAAALDLLADPALDALLAPAVLFADLPQRLPEILRAQGDARCPVIDYGSSGTH
ncbi:MAG TPA: zinc-binding alcohol dehydrogenase [Xanthobacteraceae bacterium]|nr:zinc-binding alcohol dehydrogenase [Xanthobacteraceae bacterium]